MISLSADARQSWEDLMEFAFEEHQLATFAELDGDHDAALALLASAKNACRLAILAIDL